jgi:putative ABC transport system permease protein
VRNAFNKEILRSITGSLGRFVAIFAIVALGAGFYAGLRMCAPDMRLSIDRYLNETSFMDLRLLSTLGFSDADVEAVSRIPGVNAVMPSHIADVMADVGENSGTTRVHSLDLGDVTDAGGTAELSTGMLNRPTLVGGRWPLQSGECVVDSRSLGATGSPIGQTVQFTSGVRPLEDTFSRTSFTVVGVVESSYYLSFQRGTTTLGNGDISRFIYIPETDFKNPGTYTDLFLTVEGASAVSSFGSAYGETVDPVISAIDEAAPALEASRTAEVKAEASERLAETRSEYHRAKAEADARFAEGQAQLDAAAEEIEGSASQLAAARSQYAAGVAELAAQREAFERQNADAQAQIDAARAELALQEAQLEQLGAALTALQQQVATLQAAVADLEAAYAAAASAEASGAVVSPSSAEIGVSLAETQAALAAVSQAYTEQSATYAAGIAAVESARRALDTKQAELDAGKRQAAEQFEAAQAELDSARRRISTGAAQLEEARLSLDSARATYAAEKADAEVQLADALAQIENAEAQIDSIGPAEWYVLGRDTNEGYTSLANDAKRVDAISFVFPVIFFLVAALVALTTMTRMVDEERILIGTHKALGFSGARIATKYVAYAGLASFFGAAVGILVGSQLMPRIIWYAYTTIYTAPGISTPIDPTSALIAGGAAVGVTLLATLAAVASTLREGPAALMLPRAPKPGKRILLERIRPIWSRFSFLQKVTARNLFRYKKRLLMTVAGIAGCSALLLTGFALKDSVNDVLKKQYGDIYAYNISVGVDPETFSSGQAGTGATLARALDPAGTISNALPVRTATVRVTPTSGTGNGETIEGFIRTPSDPSRLNDFVKLRSRTTGTALSLGDSGVIVTEKAAMNLGIGVGDRIRIEPIDILGNASAGSAKTFEVTGIAEQYVGNFIYVSPGLYAQSFGEQPEYNEILATASASTPAERAELSRSALEQEGVTTVRFNSDITASFGKMLESLDFVVLVLIVSAGALAFIVLYNLTNVNITERRRELATIKVLGFYESEVNAYIYRETTLLTVLGCVIGLGLGVVLEAVVIRTVEVDLVMFGRTIYATSYLYAAALTLAFAVIVNLAMRPRLRRIDMVESLKSVE